MLVVVETRKTPSCGKLLCMGMACAGRHGRLTITFTYIPWQLLLPFLLPEQSLPFSGCCYFYHVNMSSTPGTAATILPSPHTYYIPACCLLCRTVKVYAAWRDSGLLRRNMAPGMHCRDMPSTPAQLPTTLLLSVPVTCLCYQSLS